MYKNAIDKSGGGISDLRITTYKYVNKNQAAKIIDYINNIDVGDSITLLNGLYHIVRVCRPRMLSLLNTLSRELKIICKTTHRGQRKYFRHKRDLTVLDVIEASGYRE